VYSTIVNRLAGLNPPVRIEKYFALRNGRSSVKAFEYTLDGIDFHTDDPDGLIAELSTTRNPRTGKPAFTSLIEDPKHWALKASLARTTGTGFREVLRATPAQRSGTDTPKLDSSLKMRFGTAGTRLEFTSLHCAVSDGTCNVHIDDSGFFIELADGSPSLTLDSYDHIVNELLNRTDFRNWLVGLTDNESAKAVIRDVMGRINLQFINSTNGFAGMGHTLNRITGFNTSLLNLGRLLLPIGVSVDLVDRRNFKVQANGQSHSGQRSITLTIGGAF
jgi:hypothetical protein